MISGDIKSNGCALLPGVVTGPSTKIMIETLNGMLETLEEMSRVNGLIVRETFSDFFNLPQITDVVKDVLGTDSPILLATRGNASVSSDPGDPPHSNNYEWGNIAPGISIVTACLYLDKIDDTSGTFAYCPGSHLKYYPPYTEVPTQADIDAGTYEEVYAEAGDVLFRIPEVWHAVRPIGNPRRYITGFWVNPDNAGKFLSERVERFLEVRA